MVKIVPRDFFYGMIIFTILTISMVSIITLITGGSGGTDTARPDLLSGDEIVGFNRTFNNQVRIENKTNTLRTNLDTLSPETTLEAITLPVAFIKTAWNMVTLIIDSMGFMTTAIGGMSTTVLNINPIIPTMIILLIFSLFVFSIISVLFGKDL